MVVSSIVEQVLNGLSLGFVYVLLAVGLSIIFGVMHVINFSHGEMLALGAYFAVVLATRLGGGIGFVAALILAPLMVGAFGVLIERYTVQPLYDRNPLYHILLTFGLVLVINDAIVWIWGPTPTSMPTPELLSGPIDVFGITYAKYNLFMILFGALIAVGGWALLTRTRIGLIIRAGSQDREKVKQLGINIDNYYSLVFGFGAMLAGLAGVVLGGYQNVNPNMGMSVIIITFVVVIIGGLGSYKGAIVVGLGVGLVQTFVQTHVPALDGIIVFLLLIGILLVRPEGLYGSELQHKESETLLSAYDSVLSRDTQSKLALAAIGVLSLVPFGAGTLFSQQIAVLLIEILIFALFALSLDFLMGYTGMVSLGHAMFFGIGAYTVVLMVLNITQLALVAVVFVVLVSAFAARVVGQLSIRVTGIYFALITLGFAELFYNSLFEFEFTGGSDGLFGADPVYGLPGFRFDLNSIVVGVGRFRAVGDELFFFIALGTLLSTYLLLRRVLRSPFGRVLRAIRENEQRVEFVGYDTRRYKLQAFVISGVIGGLAGALFGLHWGFVDPTTAHWLTSGEVLIMVMLGGIGTLYGPMLGAGFFVGTEQLLMEYFDQARLILGVIFVLFVIFVPGGLVSMPSVVVERGRNLYGRVRKRTPGADPMDLQKDDHEY